MIVTTPAKAAGNIRELCSLGAPAPTLIPDLFTALKELVPADYCAQVWSDESGEMCGGFLEQQGQERYLQHYADTFYNRREEEVVRGFTHTMWHAAPVRTEEEHLVVPWRDFLRHDYYQEVMLPLGGIKDCLKLVLRDHQRPLGTLLLIRTLGHGGRVYSRRERERISAIYPHLCHAFAHAMDATPAPVDWIDTDKALLICDLDGCVHHLTHHARDLLFMLVNAQPSRQRLAWPAPRLPDALRPLLSRLGRIRAGRPALPARQALATAWGGIHADAHWLETTGPQAPKPLVAITLSRRIPPALLWWRRLKGHGLSGRQLQVALLLMQGLTQAEIAGRLGVRLASVTSHAQQVYLKTAVDNARQLRGRIARSDAA